MIRSAVPEYYAHSELAQVRTPAWVCHAEVRLGLRTTSHASLGAGRAGLKSLCEHSWIPAFAGMTGRSTAPKSSAVTPAEAGVQPGQCQTRVFTQTLKPRPSPGIERSGQPLNASRNVRQHHPLPPPQLRRGIRSSPPFLRRGKGVVERVTGWLSAPGSKQSDSSPNRFRKPPLPPPREGI